jgi:hypothetical protein
MLKRPIAEAESRLHAGDEIGDLANRFLGPENEKPAASHLHREFVGCCRIFLHSPLHSNGLVPLLL